MEPKICDICGTTFEPNDQTDDRENVCSVECEARWNGREENDQ